MSQGDESNVLVEIIGGSHTYRLHIRSPGGVEWACLVVIATENEYQPRV